MRSTRYIAAASLAITATLALPAIAPARPRPTHTVTAHAAGFPVAGNTFTATIRHKRERVQVAWLEAPATAYARQHLSFFTHRRGLRLHIFGRTATGAILARVTWHGQGAAYALAAIGAGHLAALPEITS